MPSADDLPSIPDDGSLETQVLREMLEHVRDVARDIVERVNKVCPDDPEKPLPPSPPDDKS